MSELAEIVRDAHERLARRSLPAGSANGGKA